MTKFNDHFDASAYAAAYPDVAESGLSPRDHYERYGKYLGRDASPTRLPALTIKDFSKQSARSPAELDLLFAGGVIGSSNAQISARGPLISVIMPCYNNELWIQRAINSVLSQHDVNLELIVVDDGSTDGSVSVAKKASALDKRVQVISLVRNFGCYYARNIGVEASKGDFVTIVDSDDIVAPDRIFKQVSALDGHSFAVASQCLQRRWTNDFATPLSDLKAGENSLLWKKDILAAIGYYDSVRFAGDSEFRLRIKRTFGADSIALVSEELYFLRSVDGSLATGQDNAAYRMVDGRLHHELSDTRKKYQAAFNGWQKSKAKAVGRETGSAIRVPFPVFERPFDLGADEQNASPMLGQRCIGCLATFPARAEALEAVIPTIIDQLDELRIYLNNYQSVPDWLVHPKIVTTLGVSQQTGDLRDNGKFFNIPPSDDAYIFTIDDDILYPADYVRRLTHYIELLGRQAIVGVHGVIFPAGEFKTLKQRTVTHFAAESSGHFVDLLGTGTTAWHSSTLALSLSDFKSKGMADLWLARAAALQDVPMFTVPRRKSWLREFRVHEDSLWREAHAQPTAYFECFNNFVAPALKQGRARLRAEAQLARGFDRDTLEAGGIRLLSTQPSESTQLNTRKSLSLILAPEKRKADGAGLRMHIIVNGWNCVKFVDDCLVSIARQQPADFDFDVTLVDDGSDDGTFAKLANSTILPAANILRISSNRGPAFARDVAIRRVSDPNTVVVLVDMDDALEPCALKSVAERYINNPSCLMTIGNWRDQNGKINPQSFYTPEEIDRQATRSVELFNATHLRTFKRFLYDAVEESDLLDEDGKWLTTCTDVALMYPLMDQCWSHEIEFIEAPIYLYNRQHGNGTLARFGKPHKVKRLAWLKRKNPKPRLNPRS